MLKFNSPRAFKDIVDIVKTPKFDMPSKIKYLLKKFKTVYCIHKN